MYHIKLLSKDDISQVIEMAPIIKCVEDVYRQKSCEETVVWPTVFYEFDPGKADMDIKSGYLKGAALFGHKTMSLFNDNREKGLQTLNGVIVVISAETGLPIGIVDGSYITGARTGAAGAIGAKYLARKNSKNLMILGAGNQAAFQIAAMLTVFPNLDKIRVADPLSFENAKNFVSTIKERLKTEFKLEGNGVSFDAVSDLGSAVSNSDIIITVTPARNPVIRKEWVKPGTHFSCIGADAEGKEEIEGTILQGARIFTDDMPHCISSGEIEIPIKKGFISKQDVAAEIGDLILGKVEGRQSEEEITVYDATGMALLDIAAAGAALKLAEEKNLGTTVEM